VTSSKNKIGASVIILLVIIIVTGAVIIWSQSRRPPPVTISLTPEPELQGSVFLDGAVHNPGIYPLESGDTIDDLIQSAGGITEDASLNSLKLYVPEGSEAVLPQKIDINRAEAWLLQALPGIGETRAQAIVDYRRKNGQFQSTNELTKVEGIGAATYEKIKDLITVSD